MGMKKGTPRTLRGAARRGWRVVQPKNYRDKNVSWLGLCIWSDIHTKGKFVHNFIENKFAFELDEDASHFLMKWGL